MQQVVPLDSSPNQTVKVSLVVDGAPLNLILVFRYNEIASYWCMTVQDANQNLLLDSIPLVTGNYPICNLLRQYSSLQIGSAYLINLSGNPALEADNTNLGTSYIPIWGDTP